MRTVEGAIEHDGALYTRQGDDCVEYGLAAGTLHAVSPPLAQDTLVWGDVEVIALADGFELDFVRFDDGATGAVPWSQAFRTVPNLYRSGWWPSLTYSESAYSQQEDCSDRLLRAQYGAGTPCVSRWAQLEQGGFAEIGAPIADTAPLFAIDEGSGSCLPIAPSALERANLFAAQSSIAASQVPLAPAHGRVPAGALEFFALAGADLVLEDAAYNDGQEWYDPALAVPCTPQARSDGRWFCTPSGMDADAPPQGVTLVELVPE